VLLQATPTDVEPGRYATNHTLALAPKSALSVELNLFSYFFLKKNGSLRYGKYLCEAGTEVYKHALISHHIK